MARFLLKPKAVSSFGTAEKPDAILMQVVHLIKKKKKKEDL